MALRVHHANVAVMELNGVQIDLEQWIKPKAAPYHGDPSIAGSFILGSGQSIQEVRDRLEPQGLLLVTNSGVQ